MKKNVIFVMLLGIISTLALLTVGCGGDKSVVDKKNTTSKTEVNGKSNDEKKKEVIKDTKEAPKEEMVLYTWAEYFPQSIFDKFEEEFGIKVKLITYVSEEDFFDNYKSGKFKYDLSTLWDLSAINLFRDGNLAELDHANIPNLKYIDDKYKVSFDKELKYTVPFASGFTCILVNTDIIKDEIKGYKDFWNPKYKKKVSLLQGEALGMALRKLGYDAFDSNIEHLKEAKAELDKLKPNVAMFNENNADTYVESGKVGLAHVWSGLSLFESITNPKLQIVFPEEGIDIWIDNFLIPKDAKNKKAAELFINFMNRPEINYEFVSFTMYATANIEARKLFKIKEYAVTSVPIELVEKAKYWKELTKERKAFDDEVIKGFGTWGVDVYSEE